jgi:hypothetical protein
LQRRLLESAEARAKPNHTNRNQLTIVTQYPHGRMAQYAATANTARKNGDADWGVSGQ